MQPHSPPVNQTLHNPSEHQKSDRGELAILSEYFVSISQLANISNFYGVPFSWLLIAF
jgi:hypothetical protein